MKYFIANNGQKEGPFEENELLAKGVTVNTLVWCEGMPQWTPAGQVAALGYLFGNAPKPAAEPVYAQAPQQPIAPPQNYLVHAILVTVLCCVPFGIVGIIKASKVNSLYAQGDYAGAQQASDEAKKWCIWGAATGVIFGIIYTIIMVIAAKQGF